MKLTSKHFFLRLEEEVTIGELKTTLVANVMGDKDSFDVEFMDFEDTTYMSIPIEGYNNWMKFSKFHKDMGIDFDKAMGDRFDQIFTKEAVKEYVDKIKF